jgi:hypothetical protein
MWDLEQAVATLHLLGEGGVVALAADVLKDKNPKMCHRPN